MAPPLQVLTLALLATVAATLKLQDIVSVTEKPPVDVNKLFDDSFFDTNPEYADGRKLYEGDMLLTEEQLQDERKFMGTSNLKYYWQDGTSGFPEVLYRFDDNLPDKTKTAILAGIAHWEKNTCLTFTLTNDQTKPHLIFVQKDGCWSYVGRIYSWKGQEISIGIGCEDLGTVAHEIGHAIGFQHEQCRSDRDNFVYINEDNIKDGNSYNFGKLNTITTVPYDYTSTMQYDIKSFTKNGLQTISTIDPLDNFLIKKTVVLTFRDLLLANTMYKCIGKWKTACGSNPPECQNDGYVAADCTCVCPPGTKGDTCENGSGNYYEGATDDCTEKVTTAGTISSPGYPKQISKTLQCAKVIIAPANQVPQVSFTGFSLYPKVDYNKGSYCYWDSLQISNDYPKTSKAYCAQDIKPGTVFKGTSQKMVILYLARTWFPGWTADVSFVPADPGNSMEI